MNSVFMSKRLIFNESGICAFSEFLASSSFRVSNKLQVSIFQISNKVQNGDFNDFLLFLKSQRSHFFEKRKEVGNGRKLENRKMEGCRNCVFPWRCLCSQSLGSSLVAYSVFFSTSVPPGGCPSFSGFCFLCACCRRAGVLRWFLSVVGSPTLSGSAEALPPPAEKLRDVLLPSLPLTKKTLLK